MKILLLGDCHCPWANPKTLSKFFDYADNHGPWDLIIQLGDLLDFYSSSKFARSHNVCTPAEELIWGREQAEEIWRILHKIDPKSKKVQLKGNHCDRPKKRLLEQEPSLELLLDNQLRLLYTFDNVQTIHNSRQEYHYRGIVFLHGYRHKLGDHAVYNLQNTACAHTHRGGHVSFNYKDKIINELNAGFVADRQAVPMRYSQQTYTKWTDGWGVWDDYGPRFIPVHHELVKGSKDESSDKDKVRLILP